MSWLKKLCERGQHCSCFFDTVFKIYIGDLCKAHDHWYSILRWSKLKADKKLFKGVRKRLNIFLASLMWLGVNTPIGWYKYYKAQKEQKMLLPNYKKLQEIKVNEVIVETDDLETVIDEAIKEIQEDKLTQEEIHEVLEQIPSEDREVLNYEVLKEVLKNRSSTVDNQSSIVELGKKESERFVEIMKELHFMKKHFGKLTVFVLIFAVACGYTMGMNDDTIRPIIGKVWEFFTSFKGDS